MRNQSTIKKSFALETKMYAGFSDFKFLFWLSETQKGNKRACRFSFLLIKFQNKLNFAAEEVNFFCLKKSIFATAPEFYFSTRLDLTQFLGGASYSLEWVWICASF